MLKEQGYAAASMRAIARAEGLAVSDAYYLPSKEHLTLGPYYDLQAAHRENGVQWTDEAFQDQLLSAWT